MTLLKNDIGLGNKPEEAEEINAPEAKRVEAPDFHSGRVGSSPIRSTISFNEKVEKDWCVEKDFGNGNFTIKNIDRQVAGITTSRLSVLKN